LVAEGVSVRAARLALSAFLRAFLASDEVDVVWRLRAAVKSSDGRLAGADGGRPLSNLTAVFLAADGTACGVSVGDSPLRVLQAGSARWGTVLGREKVTALGTGQTVAGQL
jgi:hypothetical protein